MTIVVVIGAATVPPLVAGQAAGALTGGETGMAYTTTFTTAGGVAPYTYSVVSGALPAGLSLSSGGVLSGTPSGTGNASFTVRRTDAAASTLDVAYTLDVQAPLAAVQPAGALTSRPNNTAFSFTFTSTGGIAPYTYTVAAGSLPPGTSLSSGGVLSGTPSGEGTYNFTVRRADSASRSIDTAYTLAVVSQYGVGAIINGSSPINTQFQSGNVTGSQFVGAESVGVEDDKQSGTPYYYPVKVGSDTLKIAGPKNGFPSTAKFRVDAINSPPTLFYANLYTTSYRATRIA